MTKTTAGFQPLVARTRSVHRAVGPVAYDCVKVVVIRDGTAVLFSEFGQKPVRPGDVVLLAPNTLCSSEPEGHVTVTSVSLDPDYVLDQVRWQYAGIVQDRLDAQGFADTIYTKPAQILRLGEDRAGMLMPWLDELVSLSIERQFVRDYFRIQALWFSITHVIAPFIKLSPVRVSPSQRAHIRPTLPRDRRFAPLRAEARQAATLLRETPAQRWTLDALAVTGAFIVLAVGAGVRRGVWEDAAGVSDDGARRAIWRDTCGRPTSRSLMRCGRSAGTRAATQLTCSDSTSDSPPANTDRCARDSDAVPDQAMLCARYRCRCLRRALRVRVVR